MIEGKLERTKKKKKKFSTNETNGMEYDNGNVRFAKKNLKPKWKRPSKSKSKRESEREWLRVNLRQTTVKWKTFSAYIFLSSQFSVWLKFSLRARLCVCVYVFFSSSVGFRFGSFSFSWFCSLLLLCANGFFAFSLFVCWLLFVK